MTEPITLEEFTSRIAVAVNGAPGLAGIWVTAETSDVRRPGHCYLELVQKHPLTGEPVARVRATIWRSTFARIDAAFTQATGQQFGSGIKVLVRVTASFHPAYGLSANITEIDPSYTLGDLVRRRREIIARLTDEGIIDLNRSLMWPEVPLRMAVISAPGAAGYGDFVHQLFTNPSRLDFRVRLYPALMQGASAAASIIAALEQIAADEEMWDGVVIIRGGGAVSDLASFDDYSLAFHVAQFPLPVIVGIGHERDITVLDYVANTHVKTPTAAAEALIARANAAYDRLKTLGNEILQTVSARVAGQRQQLAYYQGLLPALARNVLESNKRRIGPEIPAAIASAVRSHLARSRDRLDSLGLLLDTLAPEATLRRGYSITRAAGRAVTDSSSLRPGDTITTTFASGPDIISTITQSIE